MFTCDAIENRDNFKQFEWLAVVVLVFLSFDLGQIDPCVLDDISVLTSIESKPHLKVKLALQCKWKPIESKVHGIKMN